VVYSPVNFWFGPIKYGADVISTTAKVRKKDAREFYVIVRTISPDLPTHGLPERTMNRAFGVPSGHVGKTTTPRCRKTL
jgi:hypothetical protein